MSLATSMGVDKKVALLSVYHKEGIVDFARELIYLDWKIYASGGTAKELAVAGVPVTDVANLVGGQPIFGHRVVTLSREVYASLLCRETPEDLEQLEALGLPWIDLVCVDLYPLEDEIARAQATEESVIEKTDIGGPTLLRAAAKGRRLVIADPVDREKVLQYLKGDLGHSPALRRMLAGKAEEIVGNYALASARFTLDFDPTI